MEPNDLVATPGALFVLSVGIAVVGGIFIGLAMLIMHLIGDSIHEHARESELTKYRSTIANFIIFYSNPRNIPVFILMLGMFLIICAVFAAIGAFGWFIVRALSGG